MVSDGHADSNRGEKAEPVNVEDEVEDVGQREQHQMRTVQFPSPEAINLQSSSDPENYASPDSGLPDEDKPNARAGGSNEPRNNPLNSEILPNPTLDTVDAAWQGASRENGRKRRSPLSHGPVSFPPSTASAEMAHKSPLSARTRERGFSLRRAMFARNVHGEPERSSVALVHSLSTGRHDAESNKGSRVPGAARESKTTTTVSPTISEEYNDALSPGLLKLGTGRSSLPHYESWLKSRVARSGLFSSLRSAYKKAHKTILRIQELPPTKDGRHILINIQKGKGLIDERTSREYVDNFIRSCKYTAWNFLPRQLYAQFSKIANFYFLCVSILQMIPGLSTTGTYTTIIPLSFFVALSMAKEGFDDLRRFKLDKAENNKDAVVLRAEGPRREAHGTNADPVLTTSSASRWETTKWKDVRVGDVVKLVRDEAAPADLVVLHANGMNDVAYVETMALDGETNLKSKRAPPSVADACSTLDGISQCEAHVVVEDPNLDLYTFEGRIGIANENLPLTNNEIIYRGSIVRNTPEVLALAIYTGEECKIRMNATKNPRIKAPSLQVVVNKIVIITVLFVLALAVFNTVAYQIWQELTEDRLNYLVGSSVSFFPILSSFIILFNTMIPLSLYVSLEIVKLFQMVLMNDIEMYDEESNTPMEARTSTINEELGQINYIFSDKTGTLTNNSMRFRKMSVAGTAWFHDPDTRHGDSIDFALHPVSSQERNKGKKAARRGPAAPSLVSPNHGTTNARTVNVWHSPVARNDSVGSAGNPSATERQRPMHTAALLPYIQNRPDTIFAKKARFFLLSIALCHTCLPETKKNGEVDYQAASPDEVALVRAAQELGYMVIDRQAGTITVRNRALSASEPQPRVETYTILDVIEFSSARKRMSIVIKMPDQRICVLCKGADTTIMQLMRLAGLAEEQHLKVQRRISKRQSLEARQVIRRDSEQRARKDSITRASLSIHRPSLAVSRLRPIEDDLDDWLNDREHDVDFSLQDEESIYYSPRPSAHFSTRHPPTSFDGRSSFQTDEPEDLVEEGLVVNDAAVFERCFQHINDFASEGLRTLLYGYRYIDDEEYNAWKKLYLDASTSLVERQEKMEKVGSMLERDLELAGATAIEDKLQKGVPETIDKLRRAGIHIFMLTGDKLQTAINIGHSARMIRDYSTITVLDHSSDLSTVGQKLAAAILEINRGPVAHSAVVIDGQTLGRIEADATMKELFFELAVLVDTVICARASPSNKASLVHAIRKRVKGAITLAIGDGANDIAMIQEAHVGIGITGREGLQAARTSDYSIAQFRFLLRLLLVHGRWNYVRTCKYTLGTFWKEFLFYLTQALYQRWVGYTGTSLYESASLSMFNTLFTSLPVIFMGIFEKDLTATTLLAAPELYSFGHRNRGFSIRIYAGWIFMASAEAMVIYFLMLGLYGKAAFTLDNGLYAMGVLTFTACIVVIATKMQVLETHNNSIIAAIALVASIGGWFAWNLVLSSMYTDNTIYNVRDGFLDRFGRNALWWLTLILIVASCCGFEICVKALQVAFFPEDEDVFRELEKDAGARIRLERAAAIGLNDHVDEGLAEGDLERVRTREEEEEREGAVQHILDNRDKICRRQLSSDATQGIELEEVDKAGQAENPGYNDDGSSRQVNGNQLSSPVQEMLRKGFGKVRRSLDVG